MIYKISIKTTVAGIGSLLVGLGAFGKILNDFLLGEPVNFDQVSVAVAAITTGIGLIFARDNNLSSEDVGAK